MADNRNKYSAEETIQIYTDWANYYLERAKSKKRMVDLSADCRDGLLLADVIEAVTTFKVPDLIKKPKTQQQMFDNVSTCLNTLRAHSISGVEELTPSDICNGRLKAVLALFFALSRYKQASKQKTDAASLKYQRGSATQHTASNAVASDSNKNLSSPQHISQPNLNGLQQDMTNRQLPAPYGKTGTNGGTAIPLPATVLVARRCPPDKVRPLPPTPNHQSGLTNKSGTNSDASSRPGSPPSIGGTPSHIPKGGNSLRQPQNVCKIPASPYAVHGNISNGHIPNGGNQTPAPPPAKHSMLDKLKLFNKDKSSDRSTKTQISKRTSSSSGFSSARSERSDSSLSLNDGHAQQQQQQQSTVLSNNGTLNNKNSIKKNNETTTNNSAKLKVKLLPKGKNSSKDASSKTKEKDKLSSASRDEKESQIDSNKTTLPPKSQTAMAQTKSKSSDTKIKAPASSSTSTLNRKLETRSESRNSLSSSQIHGSKSMIPPPPTNQTTSTGIPKPMAAIKGTTKPSTVDKMKTDQISTDLIKSTSATGDISNVHNPNISNFSESKTIMMNTIGIPNGCGTMAPPSNGISNGHHIQKQTNPVGTLTETESIRSSNSTNGIKSVSSDSGNTLYRQNSEPVPDSLYYQTRLTNMIGTDPVMYSKYATMNNSDMNRFNEPNDINKFNTAPLNKKYIGPPSVGQQLRQTGQQHQMYPEEEKQMTILPMRPLLRGYNSHVTLPTRGVRSGQHMVSDYYDGMNMGGYCSDGDALKKPTSSRFSDIDNGYLSEGGGSSSGIPNKHFMSVLRARSQLPTTIEERCRTSKGENLDSLGSNASAMELNGSNSGLNDNLNGRITKNGQMMGGREQWGKLGDTQNGHQHQVPSSPTHSRKDKSSPSHSRRSGSSKSGQSRSKAVPQSFGYVKRSNGTNSPVVTDGHHQSPLLMGAASGARTAHVSAVPRSNKLKVSGGTQTCSAELQGKLHTAVQHRSFSLTGPSAAQLSQSIRDRLSTGSHSLPKPGSDLQVFQQRLAHRNSAKLTDGSLSDTQTYAEVGSYAMWLKHSNTTASRLSDGDNFETMGIGSPGGIGSPRNHKLMQRESQYVHSPRLNRSNSIRSTKSEKMYPSMLSRGPDLDIEPYYCLPVGSIQSTTAVAWSQPTSPTPPTRGFNGPLSPTHGGHRMTYPKKNDDVHGSNASLLSGGSSLYGSTEERQANEVRRLKRELTDAREQVMSLSTKLSTNAQVVAAFEQSLTNMTQRLQQLTSTAERKDSELHEMRQTIELLRKQSIQAGLTTAHMQSMGTMQSNNQNQSINKPTANGIATTDGTNGNGPQISPMQRHHSTDSMCSLNSLSSGCSTQDKKKKKGWLRSSFTKAFSRNAKITKTNRHHLQSSNNLDQSHPPLPPTLNNSSGYQSTLVADSALPPPSPSKSPQKMMTVIENAKPIDDIENNPIVEDLKKQLREKDLVLTDIRLEALSSASQLENLKDTVMKMTTEMMILKQNNERLEKLVTSRSLAGSDVSLGIPGSPVNSLNEARRYSLIDGMPRPPMDLPKSLDETEEENIPPAPAPEPPPPLSPMSSRIDLTPPPPPPLDNGGTNGDVMTNAGEDAADHTDGKKIAIAVYLGQPESFAKYSEDLNETDYYYASPNRDIQENGQDKHKSYSLANGFNETVIAYTYISNKTTWQNLDYIVRKTFKDYLAKIDPNTNLGLNTDSITSYHLGDAKRGPEIGFPELLPCGYIVGNVRTLYVCLQGVGSLAFDSLIPRSIVHRYISLLTEHRRLILCGPSGTGKSYLARKLAEFLVARTGRDNPSEAIATFNVDHKTTKEFRQYLNHIAEQASIATNGAAELPAVIILDNLHHAAATGDIFQCLLSAGSAGNLPCIIGTMSQATCSTTNLQIHHNFRWVLTANHMEPVKGFLGRFLRRRLQSIELSSHSQQPELAAVFAWLPTVWQHINRFLETHSSSDVTIGPRLFLQCPLNLKDSQAWFTDVWNYHLAPYLVDAVREGVQLYGRRGGVWVDPCTFIRDTYPWPHAPGQIPPLRQINAEDVGLEGTDNCGDSQDPLMNMLKHLLEVADTSHNQQEQESDCASQCSNMTQDSSMGVEINE